MTDQQPPITTTESTKPPTPEAQLPPKLNSPIIKSLDDPSTPSMSKKLLTNLFAAFIITLLGITSGFGVSRVFSLKSAPVNKTSEQIQSQGVVVGDVIGSPDEGTFKDKAEGVLIKGGVNGEGSHHLIRPGGPDQNVYLTSSVLDLDELVNHKITVWGETFAAQKAGWLMDVGRAEILELNAEKPFDEELPQ